MAGRGVVLEENFRGHGDAAYEALSARIRD
jgi:hypothetical protein